MLTVQPGRMFVYETGQLTPPRFIVNFPAKRHWRGKSRIVDIEAGLVDLVKGIRDKGIRSIAIPPLGAGLGGLDWSDVRSRIKRALAGLEGVQVATVHWVMRREGTIQHASVERQVYDWNARKRQFTPRQLAIAEERLRSQGWLSVEVALPH